MTRRPYQIFRLSALAAKHSTLNREGTVRVCDGPPGYSGVAELAMRLAVNQEMCRFESCPQSHIVSPPGGRRLKPPYTRSQRTAAWILDRHQGRGPSRGCRLATALLLQRRSVEFDPLPRHQFGTYAESERHLTLIGTRWVRSPQVPPRRRAMEIIENIPVWGTPVGVGAQCRRFREPSRAQ